MRAQSPHDRFRLSVTKETLVEHQEPVVESQVPAVAGRPKPPTFANAKIDADMAKFVARRREKRGW